MESYRVQVERLYQRSSFYRNKLRAAGFESPRAVGGLERIAELPFTEKDELRASQAAHPPPVARPGGARGGGGAPGGAAGGGGGRGGARAGPPPRRSARMPRSKFRR